MYVLPRGRFQDEDDEEDEEEDLENDFSQNPERQVGRFLTDDEINRHEAMTALQKGDWISEDDLQSNYGVNKPEELMIQMEAEGKVERMYNEYDKSKDIPMFRLKQEEDEVLEE